jgi:hypothetical protein
MATSSRPPPEKNPASPERRADLVSIVEKLNLANGEHLRAQIHLLPLVTRKAFPTGGKL